MRYILLFLSLFLYIQSSALDISVSYATFKGDKSDYVEVYLYAVGSTLTQMPIEDNFQSNIEVTVLFKQGENILQFDKFLLNSPISKDTTDFIDLKRYGLTPGKYTMEVLVVDQNNLENKGTFKSNEFSIDYTSDQVHMSDIQLLVSCKPSKEESPFVKNGFFLEPTPFNFYNKNLNTLFFYTEIYNTLDKVEENFTLTYTITEDSKLATGKEIVIGHKMKSAAEMSLMLMPIDIKELPSGNYILKVQAKNGDKLLTNKAVSFQRLNPYIEPSFVTDESFDITKTFVHDLNEEELTYSLRALMPKMYGTDTKILNNILTNGDKLKMQTQLFTYWANRDPNNPEAAYDKYMVVAKAVDNQFHSGLGHGFESDRGFIFLRYGKPTSMITITDEPEAPPYEIWYYDQFPFTTQTDVKFLFYNPSYAAGQYSLLHSNARGELNNPNWLIALYKNIDDRDRVGSDILNQTEVTEGFNRNAARYFNDF